MTITLLLVLAGALGTEGTGPSALASAGAVASSEVFKTGPEVLLWKPAQRPLRMFGLARLEPAVVAAEPVARPASPGPIQLQNPRTGVTCTMRILEVKPTIDPGIIASVSGPHPDPIVRNASSPCAQ